MNDQPAEHRQTADRHVQQVVFVPQNQRRVASVAARLALIQYSPNTHRGVALEPTSGVFERIQVCLKE